MGNSARPIAFVTSAELRDLMPDDRLLQAALAGKGIEAVPVVWTDSEIRWEAFHAVFIRTPWDYYERFAEFERFVAGLPTERSFNSPTVLKWNLDKAYLREFEAAGIPIVPTRWFRSSDPEAIRTFLASAGAGEWVVKPARSAGAHQTYRFTVDELPDASAFRDQTLLLQPFLPEIVSGGEVSLIYFDGKYSHAIVKKPKPGDFRVQSKHGGNYTPIEPTTRMREFAERALSFLRKKFVEVPFFVRIDFVIRNGCPELMELEALEPDLYLRMTDSGLNLLVSSIIERVNRLKPA